MIVKNIIINADIKDKTMKISISDANFDKNGKEVKFSKIVDDVLTRLVQEEFVKKSVSNADL